MSTSFWRAAGVFVSLLLELSSGNLWTFCQLPHRKFEPLDWPAVRSVRKEEKPNFTKIFTNTIIFTSSCTEVENSAHDPKVECSNPATGIGREKISKTPKAIILPSKVLKVRVIRVNAFSSRQAKKFRRLKLL